MMITSTELRRDTVAEEDSKMACVFAQKLFNLFDPKKNECATKFLIFEN